MQCAKVQCGLQLVLVALQTFFWSARGEHDQDVMMHSVASTHRVLERQHRPYLGSWEYSGCGNKPCPGGTKLDIAPHPWSVKDYIVQTADGPRAWQTLIFTVCLAHGDSIEPAGSNLTQAAEVHSKVYQQTNQSLPVLWEWNAWRTLPSRDSSGSVDTALLDASVHNFSVVYNGLVEQFPQLPSSPFGIALGGPKPVFGFELLPFPPFLCTCSDGLNTIYPPHLTSRVLPSVGDEPPWELVRNRLADSAAAVKRRYPSAVTHINLEYVTITNSSVPPILGAAQSLDWLGSDLYYDDHTTTPPINASVPAFRAMYEKTVYPHLRPDQKIVLVPFAHYCEFYCPIGALPLDHADAYTRHVAEEYTDWADHDERVVALLVYSLKMVWVPVGADVCENPAYTIGSGNLTVTPWDTTWAGNGIGLTDRCVQDAAVSLQPCPPMLPPSPLGHLRSEWLLGDDGTIALAASSVGSPMCFSHFIPPQPCNSPGHRTYRVENGTNVPTCDDFLGQLQDTSGLSVSACNSTRAVFQRQQWSCLDSTNCAGPSRIQATGEDVGCERLPNYQRPPAGVPIACCLTYVRSPGSAVESGKLGLNQCGNIPGENTSHYGEQHFQLLRVESGSAGGPQRFTIQLSSSVSPGQCVQAAEPGYALPQTLKVYQDWSLRP